MTNLLSLLIHIEYVAVERLEGLCDFLPRRIQEAFGGTLSGQLYVVPKGPPLPWLRHAWTRQWVWKDIPLVAIDSSFAVLNVAEFGRAGLILKPSIFLPEPFYFEDPQFVLEWYLIPEETPTESTLYSIERELKTRKLGSVLTQCGLKVAETRPLRFPRHAAALRSVMTPSLLTVLMHQLHGMPGEWVERLEIRHLSGEFSWLKP